jgi:hypothetical protein
MRPVRGRLLGVAAVLAVAAACTGQPSERWERPEDHMPAGVVEISDCHFQSRRQADNRYPPLPQEQIGRWPNTDDSRRFPAELAFYRDCMRQKGYVQVE